MRNKKNKPTTKVVNQHPKKTAEDIMKICPSLRTNDDYRILIEHIEKQHKEMKYRIRGRDFTFLNRNLPSIEPAVDCVLNSLYPEIIKPEVLHYAIRHKRKAKTRYWFGTPGMLSKISKFSPN